MRPYDSVILTEDLSESLTTGTEGTIVDQYTQVKGVYSVELFDREGNTLDVVEVRADQISVTLADFFAGEHVALLADIPSYQLIRGQVGVIQERVGVGLYAVEFLTPATGIPPRPIILHASQMLLLHGHFAQTKQSA